MIIWHTTVCLTPDSYIGHPFRRLDHDCYHDLPYQVQIHCCRYVTAFLLIIIGFMMFTFNLSLHYFKWDNDISDTMLTIINHIYIGRKEIVMFFYLYILTTIVELLLVSGWIPVASDLYPVNHIHSFYAWNLTFVVVCGNPCRLDYDNVLVLAFKWLCWLSMGWRRNAHVRLGKTLFIPYSRSWISNAIDSLFAYRLSLCLVSYSLLPLWRSRALVCLPVIRWDCSLFISSSTGPCYLFMFCSKSFWSSTR
jgi:hypothetical protein